ncbi:MAG: Uma2 family endonuclease [Tunicatimonas sp.]
MPAVIDRHTFTVDEYHRMAETGILTEDDRVELINGEIIAMSPINSPHGGSVKRINNYFSNLLGNQVIVSVQDPLVIGDASEPEPDVMLLKPRDDFYASAHPQPKDVYLLIEVADSSLHIDRKVKLPVYALAGVSEVWIVNLMDKQIEVFHSPSTGRYQGTKTIKSGHEIIVPHFLLRITADVLLG